MVEKAARRDRGTVNVRIRDIRLKKRGGEYIFKMAIFKFKITEKQKLINSPQKNLNNNLLVE
jgi:hypothetical protein